MSAEFGLSAKLLELLKQIAPAVKRVVVLRAPAAGVGVLGAIQAVAPSFGVELTPVGDRNGDEIERGITAFVRGPTDGMIVTSAGLTPTLRDLVIALAARHRLPAIYSIRRYVTDGGLMSFVVPTGIAIGAHYEWLADYNRGARMTWRGNIESQTLSELWEVVRERAHQNLRSDARTQGNGVLAHLNFSQMFESEKNKVPQYLARHIVVATTVDAKRGTTLPHDIKIMVDTRAGSTRLTGTKRHHQSYASNEAEGPI